jgi:endonuclease III
MEIEKSVEYIQLKAIFDELFDRVAQRIEVVPKVEKEKTEKQIQNMKKKALMEILTKSKARE